MRWVKAHQDVASLDGQDRILAIFNGYADAEAKKVVVERARCALYRELFASCHANKGGRRPTGGHARSHRPGVCGGGSA